MKTTAAATTAVSGEHDDLTARVGTTGTVLATAGAKVERLRELGQLRAVEGWPSKLEEFTFEADLRDAERACEAAGRQHADARDRLVGACLADYERLDAADVAEEADLLVRLAVVERRRVDRLQAFERRTGRQVQGETGLWPELYHPASGDMSRLDRWLKWAQERRGVKA